MLNAILIINGVAETAEPPSLLLSDRPTLHLRANAPVSGQKWGWPFLPWPGHHCYHCPGLVCALGHLETLELPRGLLCFTQQIQEFT